MVLHDFTAKLGTGEEQSLAAYRGQALLIVNVASKCGFTAQYQRLQAMPTKPERFSSVAVMGKSFSRSPHCSHLMSLPALRYEQ